MSTPKMCHALPSNDNYKVLNIWFSSGNGADTFLLSTKSFGMMITMHSSFVPKDELTRDGISYGVLYGTFDGTMWCQNLSSQNSSGRNRRVKLIITGTQNYNVVDVLMLTVNPNPNLYIAISES